MKTIGNCVAPADDEIVIEPVDALTVIPVPADMEVTPALVSEIVPLEVIVPPPDKPVPAEIVTEVTVPFAAVV